jgi:hypothetical protein
MITLKEWMEVVDYRITEGDEYGWPCYGDNVYQLSAWNGVHGKGGWSFCITFDTKDQTVYSVEACDYTNERAYRLINPDYFDAHNDYAKTLGDYANQAWDDVDFVDLDVDDDWLQKALAIKAGEDYSTDVLVPLDIPKDELFEYMILAHEKNMTLNQLIEEALRAAVEEHERDPEAFKARAEKWKANNDPA